jgi:hypothetical protein
MLPWPLEKGVKHETIFTWDSIRFGDNHTVNYCSIILGSLTMLHHIKTLRAGDAGYLAPRKRNTIDVYHDQKRYIYEKPDQFVNANRQDWKLTLLCAFDADQVKTIKPMVFEIL